MARGIIEGAKELFFPSSLTPRNKSIETYGNKIHLHIKFFVKMKGMKQFFQKKALSPSQGNHPGATSLIFLIVLAILWGMPVRILAQYKKAEEAKGIPVGTVVKPFVAKTAEGKRFSLKQALEKGPVVLVFYRGQWCPVCNKHLRKLQDSLSLITDKGAQLIAVSPEKPELLSKTREKTGAAFPLLYDEGYAIANLFDVTFLPAKATRVLYNTAINANLKEAHSDDSERLPIPATFVLDQKGKVLWRQVDPDYKVRASVQDILRNLPE